MRIILIPMAALLSAAGCATPRVSTPPADRTQLQRRAMESLKAALTYRDNPVVRAQAVEALESIATEEVRPWIRSAMLDEHPGVRFAACMAAGRLRDAAAESALRARLNDPNASVRVGAIYALHRLGRTEQSGRLTWYLLDSKDVSVRRNAAIALGLLGEPSAVKALAYAMKDGDGGVRQHALEGMARLGNMEARQELAFMANSGVGSEEVFALNALAATGDSIYEDTFRYKLANGSHLETRLAAARGLGRLRNAEGLSTAMEGLRLRRAPRADPSDPGSDQLLRIHQLAAAAAGAIGREEAMGPLTELLDRSGDPRVQVSAARAVIEIYTAVRGPVSPFGEGTPSATR